jgi:hypothetical protein
MPGPHGGKVTRRVVVQIIDPTNDKILVDSDTPTTGKSAVTGSRYDQVEVRNDECFGGVLEGPSIW